MDRVPVSRSGVVAAGIVTASPAGIVAALPAAIVTSLPAGGEAARVAPAAGARDESYLPVLDGLRAVSILLVVLSHLGLDRVVPGAFGVTLFFFISGFLITRQLCAGLGRRGQVAFGLFYARRALRLMPAASVYIAVAGLAFSAAGGAISPAGWAAAVFYGANYYDLFVGYRSTLAGVRHPFNILWSLAIEEHFYVIWPAVLALAWRRAGAALWILLAVCAGVLIWRGWLFSVCFGPAQGAPWVCGPRNPNPAWLYNRLYLATDTRLDSIAWGAVLAVAPIRGSRRLAAIGALLLVAAFLVPGPFVRQVLRPSLQGIALLALLPWLLTGAGAVQRALSKALCWGPARLLGRLSYSLYLWHWAALGFADWMWGADRVAWMVSAVALSGLLAGASYWGIERPMLQWRRRFGSQAISA